MMFVSSRAIGERSFATFAVPVAFLKPVFMLPSRRGTSLPSISRVGTSRSRLPYLMLPSAVSKRMRRSNEDILNVVVEKAADAVLRYVTLDVVVGRIVCVLFNAARDVTKRRPADLANMRRKKIDKYSVTTVPVLVQPDP